MFGSIHRYVGNAHLDLQGKRVVLASQLNSEKADRFVVFLIDEIRRCLSPFAYDVGTADVEPTGESWPAEIPAVMVVIFERKK